MLGVNLKTNQKIAVKVVRNIYNFHFGIFHVWDDDEYFFNQYLRWESDFDLFSIGVFKSEKQSINLLS